MTYLIDENGSFMDKFYIFNVQDKHAGRLLKAPIETGEQSIDHKVIDPIELEITGYVYTQDVETISKLLKMQKSKDREFYALFSDSVLIPNLILESFVRKNNSDAVDTYEFSLTLVEAMLVQNKRERPMDPAYSKTKNEGRISPSKSSFILTR